MRACVCVCVILTLPFYLSHSRIVGYAPWSDAMLSVQLSVLLQVRVASSRGGGVDTGWSGGKSVGGSEAEITLSSWSSDCFLYCLCRI